MSPNLQSPSTKYAQDILGGIEGTHREDGNKLRGRYRTKRQRHSLTLTEAGAFQSDLDADDEGGYQANTGVPRDGLEDDAPKPKRAKDKTKSRISSIVPAETKNRLTGPVTWKTPAQSKLSLPLGAGVSDGIPSEPKSDSEDWDQINASETEADIGTGEWNTVQNPAAFFGVIPPDQESEPGSDLEDFDKVYTSEADMDTDEEMVEKWTAVNSPGVFCGAVGVELDGPDDGERPRPGLLIEREDWEYWLEYWSRAKELYSIMGQAARHLL